MSGMPGSAAGMANRTACSSMRTALRLLLLLFITEPPCVISVAVATMFCGRLHSSESSQLSLTV